MSVSPTTEREINLGAVVQVIWDRGRKIAGFAFITAVLVYLASLALPDRYGAWAQLILDTSKVGERSLANDNLFNVETFVHFVGSDEQLQQIMEDHPELKAEPYNFEYAEDLEGRIHVNRVGETSVIEIYVELEEPELAAAICNELAISAEEKNKDLVRSEIGVTLDLFDDAMRDRFEKSKTLRQHYLGLLKEHHIDGFRTGIANERSIKEGMIAQMYNLKGTREELEARIQELEKQLASILPRIPLTRSLSDDPDLLELHREKRPKGASGDILSVTLTVEEVNDSYFELERELAGLRAQLIGDSKKYDYYEKQVGLLEKKIYGLEDDLFEMEMAQEYARTEWLRSFEIESGIDKEEGWAPASVAASRANLQVLHRAVADDKAESPKRAAIAGVAGMMAFLLSLAYFILRDLHHIVVDRSALGL